MLNLQRALLGSAISLLIAQQAAAQINNDVSQESEQVYVYGEQGESDAATKLDLAVDETPQNITTISRAQIQDFQLTKINDVLDYAPGVTVEEIENTRTYYTARGFDIVNFKYDGVGAPFISGINRGQQDTAMFEKVQVIKGATGIISGVGNPSATINFVRKRPTDTFTGSAALSVGEWQQVRTDVDVSGAITSAVRARGVLAYEEGDAYLDRYSDETFVGYGIVEADLTSTTQLTVGHSVDKFKANGVLWGALPLTYSDGSTTDLDVSTSTAPEWTSNDITETQTFVELSQDIGSDWSFNLAATQREIDSESKLFYVYGVLDRETQLGLNGWAGSHSNDAEETNIEVFFSGDLSLWGKSHQIVAGYSAFDVNELAASYYNNLEGFPVLGSDWAEGNTPEMDFPDHDPATQTGDVDLKQESFYIASRWQLLDNLSLLLGARTNDFEQSGISYGGDQDAEADQVTPYAGVSWEAVEGITLYSSYSEVFSPQTFVTEDLTPIGAVTGSSTELGVKKSLNNESAYLTVGIFKSELTNFGEFIGRNDDGIAIYEAATYENEGLEIELAGEVAEGVNISAGYTFVDIEDPQGEESRPFIPKRTINISGSYVLPALPEIKLAAALKWQDDIRTTAGFSSQNSYTVLDLAAFYEIYRDVTLSVFVDNVTDEKYLNSLYWDQAFYAAPRNIGVSALWNF